MSDSEDDDEEEVNSDEEEEGKGCCSMLLMMSAALRDIVPTAKCLWCRAKTSQGCRQANICFSEELQ
jgi:hypothetical protein